MKLPALAAIAALAACTPVYAQEESGKSEAADTIRWPVPWKVGQVLTYETENLESEQSPKKREKLRSTDKTTITITEATTEGYVQRWVSTAPTFEVLEGDTKTAAMMESVSRSLSDVAILVELDKDANYKGIRNLAEISSRVRAALEPLIAAGVEEGVRKADQDASEAEVDAAIEKAKPQLARMLDGLTSPAFLEGSIGQVVQNYNGFVGVELEDGSAYTLETELDNPMGEKKFPANLEFGLYASEDDPDDIFLEWKSSIDPRRGADAIWELAEKLVGTTIPKDQRKALPKEISIVDEGFLIFNRGSGVIEMYENERKLDLGDTHKLDRDRMRLVDGDHEHHWKEEDDVATD